MTAVTFPPQSSKAPLEEGLAGIDEQEERHLLQAGQSFTLKASTETVLQECQQVNVEVIGNALERAVLKGQKIMMPASDRKSKSSIADAIEKMALHDTSQEIGYLIELAVWKILALVPIMLLAAAWFLVNAFACTIILGHDAVLPDRTVLGTNGFNGSFATFAKSVDSLLRVLTLRDWPELVQPVAQHAPAALALIICHAVFTAAMLLGVWLLLMCGSSEVVEAGSTQPRCRPLPRFERSKSSVAVPGPGKPRSRAFGASHSGPRQPQLADLARTARTWTCRSETA